MKNDFWTKYRCTSVLLLSGLFYIVWNAFAGYRPFYFHDESVLSPFSLYDNINYIRPIYLIFTSWAMAIFKSHDLINIFILVTHFLNSILFFGLFDRNNKIPWATVFFIFSPFVFYDLTLQDYRQPLIETLGILYIYINYTKQEFKFKNILIITLLLFGICIDYSFLLFSGLDLFYKARGRDFFVKVLVASAFVAIIVHYDMHTLKGVTPLAHFVYRKDSIPMAQNLLHFVNSALDFFGGISSFGISFIEHKVIMRDIFLKITFVIAILVLVVKYYRKMILQLILFLALLFVFNFFIQSNSMVVVLAGIYSNTIAVKASLLLSGFMALVYGLSVRKNLERPLVYFGLIVACVSWLNYLNNTSYNIFNIHRNDAPVFWGLLQNKNLNFKKTYSQNYSTQLESLTEEERIFAEGLKKIKKDDCYKFSKANMGKTSLLDVFFYMAHGQYLMAQESLGELFLNHSISKNGFQALSETINANFEFKLESTIHPLIFELLTKKESFGLAESLYLLSLYQYKNLSNDNVRKMLTNEFGPIFKPQR